MREEEDARRKAEQEYAEEQRRRAEEAEQHAAMQARSISRIKKLAIGLVVFLVVTVGTAGLAFRASQQATQQSRVAIIRSLVAYALQDNAQDKRERAALLARHAYLLNQRYHGNVQDQIDAALRTIFLTDSIKEEPYNPVLVEQVCQKVKFTLNLTPTEWSQFTGNTLSYEPACPELQTIYPMYLRREKMITDRATSLTLTLNLREDGRNVGYPTQYVENQIEDRGDVIFDRATGLMWQKSGSPYMLTSKNVQKYVEQLNQREVGGYADWRLPTVEELLSLIENIESSAGLFIHPKFDAVQYGVWSADIYNMNESPWIVNFSTGFVVPGNRQVDSYVRCVRSE